MTNLEKILNDALASNPQYSSREQLISDLFELIATPKQPTQQETDLHIVQDLADLIDVQTNGSVTITLTDEERAELERVWAEEESFYIDDAPANTVESNKEEDLELTEHTNCNHEYNRPEEYQDYYNKLRVFNENETVPVSDTIRKRIIEANVPFFANHNISEYIQDGELDQMVEEVASKMEGVLRSLVIDIDNDHNSHDTARRFAKMVVLETYSGRYRTMPKVTSFPNMGYDDLYLCGPIDIRSQCSHHLQNIVGKCWVGVFPEDEVIGLSKFNRIVDWIASRPQIQEEMTSQIADALVEYAKTPNVAVVVQAEHGCMSHRGVKAHESNMTTAIMRGKFRDDKSLKDEFYKLLQLKK